MTDLGSTTMKTKQFFANAASKALALAATVMMMSMAFSACSSDNDDPKPDPDASKYVDLGLPSRLKWATCNLGATKPEAFGDYYAWGETTTKSKYSWSNYNWCEEDGHHITKYCTNATYGNKGFVDGKSTLEAADDVATVKLGSSWRMPTADEIKELIDKCNWEWTQLNGVKGYRVTGPNSKSIFLPAAGFRRESTLMDAGSRGLYWSSSLCSACRDAKDLAFGSDHHELKDGVRNCGFSVRPVHP